MWRYGPIRKEQKMLGDLLKALTILKCHDLRGTGVIGAYHIRRQALLMACALLMYQMTPDSALEGTVTVTGEALNIGEMAQRIKEAMECPADLALVYLVLGHPSMRPNMGFVELVSLL